MKFIGLQLDIARQKESLEFIKSYIDFAKANGYNSLFLYIEASIRTKCAYFFDETCSYSEDEIRSIVDYSNKQGIDIIPALENLSHMENFFAYKELEDISECEDSVRQGRGFASGRGSCGCVSNSKLYDFMDKYFVEVINLFSSKYVHIGMDEPFDFAVCPLCKARLKNGETKKDLFLKHVLHTYNLVKKLGKTVMMWDDFFEYLDIVEALPRDIVFCNWNYSFINDEPAGHWVNRKKRDWFRYYDELGFKYIYCVYGHRTSSTYNMDSFDVYAKKYNPIGALMTMWCRADSFYFCSYPYIAYAGRVWSKIAKAEEKSKIFEEFIGDKNLSKLLSSIQLFYSDIIYLDIDKVVENSSIVSYQYNEIIKYVDELFNEYILSNKFNRLSNLQRDIVFDIFANIRMIKLSLELQNIGLELFDNYETKKMSSNIFVEKLLQIKNCYLDIFNKYKLLWQKYRNGIESYDNQFFNKFNNKLNKIDKLVDSVKNNKCNSVLYLDLMVPDIYGTGKFDILVKYKNVNDTVYTYPSKPNLISNGGISTLRFAIKDDVIQYVDFLVYGESSSYPLNFRYTQKNRKYVASKVEKICGHVKDINNILINDTQFCEMGYNDGLKHFDNVLLSRKKSGIRVYFDKL